MKTTGSTMLIKKAPSPNIMHFSLYRYTKSRKPIGDRSLGHCQIELMEADSHHVSAAGRGCHDDIGDKPRDREHIVTVCDTSARAGPCLYSARW